MSEVSEKLDLSKLDHRVAELAERYRPLAVAILQEAIRIPADEVDRPVDDGGDPRSGLSNHESRRLRFPARHDHRHRGRAPRRRRVVRRLRQPGLGRARPVRRRSTGTPEDHLLRRSHRHGAGPARPMARQARAAPSTPTTGLIDAAALTSTALRNRARLRAPRRRVGAPRVRSRFGRSARRRRRPDRRHQDPAGAGG